MKYTQPPLKINCDGLSGKRIQELAEKLRQHFAQVEVWDEDIYAGHPFGDFHYNTAWHIIDKFGVKAA